MQFNFIKFEYSLGVVHAYDTPTYCLVFALVIKVFTNLFCFLLLF